MMEAWILAWFVKFDIVQSLEKLSFENPEWLGLVFIWPILWGFAWLQSRYADAKDDLAENRSHQQMVVKHNLIHLMKQSSTSAKAKFSLSSDLLLQLLRGVLIILLAITLANPVETQPNPSKPQTKTVRDIVFVIESSASFLLPDYQIGGKPETRMNVVKAVLDDFIAKLDGNRFSIAIYADKAFTLLPMTYDQTLARLTLKRLKPYLAGRADTAMGEALGLALQQADIKLQIKKSDLDDIQNRKKVVVLISDGLSLPSRLALTEAVNYAQLLEVPVYTIGVGASSEEADKRVYSGLLYQPLESESLNQIAAQTGGQYYQVGSHQEISQVLEKINQAEGVPYIPPPQAPQTRSLYHYPLALVVSVLFLYWLLSVFMTGGTLQNQRGEES